MAEADWTYIPEAGGSFFLAADAQAPSPGAVMNLTNGNTFRNITGGSFKNARISGWYRQVNSGVTPEGILAVRSLDTNTFATASWVRVKIKGGVNIESTIEVISGGAVIHSQDSTTTSVAGNTSNAWSLYRFSVFTSGASTYLRFEQWDGAAFVVMLDVLIPTASMGALDASGRYKFGTVSGSGTNKWDDISLYSLA